jgi:chemotaxis protein methyltransferase CheR
MQATIPETLLERLSACLAKQVGLHFPRARWADLEHGIRGAAGDFGFANAMACAEWLLSAELSRRQVEVLAGRLTVGETYFFRERAAFEVLRGSILPEWIRTPHDGERRLRLWSAGCASGEEPYSLAILLREMLGGASGWNITILATDINPRSLEKAAEGVYGDWSFRGMPPGLLERYFRRKEKHYEISPEIRRMVTFDYLNLAVDAYPSLASNTNALNVIFCRNVLMYFTPAQAERVIEKLRRSLVDGGWLIVSPCETSFFSEFAPVQFDGATFYRKDGAKPRPAGSWFPPAEVRENSTPQFATPTGAFEPTVPAYQPPEEPVRADMLVCPEGSAEPSAMDTARVLYARGEYSQVVETLARDGAVPVEHPEAAALLARALANQGRLAEALEWSEKAVRAEKLHAGHQYLRAAILLELGALEAAREAWKRTLYLDPDFVLAHVGLANLARRQGEAEASAKHLAAALRILAGRPREEITPESEGMTVGRLIEMITAQQGRDLPVAEVPRTSVISAGARRQVKRDLRRAG